MKIRYRCRCGSEIEVSWKDSVREEEEGKKRLAVWPGRTQGGVWMHDEPLDFGRAGQDS